MIHPQVRREPVPSEAAGRTVEAVLEAPTHVPRQVREHPDAYDLYAQIYALRADLSADDSG